MLNNNFSIRKQIANILRELAEQIDPLVWIDLNKKHWLLEDLKDKHLINILTKARKGYRYSQLKGVKGKCMYLALKEEFTKRKIKLWDGNSHTI
jgi:hypothetical protein